MDDDVNFLFAAALRYNIFPRTSSVVEELTVFLLVCSSCFDLLCFATGRWKEWCVQRVRAP